MSAVTDAPRRSISAVAYSETAAERAVVAPPRRSISGRTYNEVWGQARRLSVHGAGDYERATQLRRQSLQLRAGADNTVDLASYYAFSRRKSSIVAEDQTGLSGFLEYRKLDGSWRSFLFQTVGFQLVVFRVHAAHQVQIMSTDIRDASEIALADDGDLNNSRVLRLGIDNTMITLRAVSHHAAMYWVDGLQKLKAGSLPEILRDRPTLESEDDIFRQIDLMTDLREWRPTPSLDPPMCGLCLPCFGQCCSDPRPADAAFGATAAFAVTHSPRPIRG